jgi:purine-binding chemotaxis protein CheW
VKIWRLRIEMFDNNDKKRKAETLQYIVFSLDKQEYGINVMNCQEIFTTEELTTIPESPNFVEGVINLREEIIPIIDLGVKLNLDTNLESEKARVIIVSIEGTKAGLLVKDVKEIKKIETENISDAPKITKSIKQKYIKGIAQTEERLLVLIEPNNLFSQSEIEKIGSI